jgi:hypothetical protein
MVGRHERHWTPGDLVEELGAVEQLRVVVDLASVCWRVCGVVQRKRLHKGVAFAKDAGCPRSRGFCTYVPFSATMTLGQKVTGPGDGQLDRDAVDQPDDQGGIMFLANGSFEAGLNASWQFMLHD